MQEGSRLADPKKSENKMYRYERRDTVTDPFIWDGVLDDESKDKIGITPYDMTFSNRTAKYLG
jgi:hypothetical protein